MASSRHLLGDDFTYFNNLYWNSGISAWSLLKPGAAVPAGVFTITMVAGKSQTTYGNPFWTLEVSDTPGGSNFSIVLESKGEGGTVPDNRLAFYYGTIPSQGDGYWQGWGLARRPVGSCFSDPKQMWTPDLQKICSSL